MIRRVAGGYREAVACPFQDYDQNQQRLESHRKKLNNIEAKVDNRNITYLKCSKARENSRKTNRVVENRSRQIDRDNKILAEKLVKTYTDPNAHYKVTNTTPKYPTSMQREPKNGARVNTVDKKYKQQQIDKKNDMLVSRLINTKSNINQGLDKHARDHAKYGKNLSRHETMKRYIEKKKKNAEK